MLAGVRWTGSRPKTREVSGVKQAGHVIMIVVTVTLFVAAVASAAPEQAAEKPSAANAGLLGLAAAIAVGLGAIGTAWAQSRIGAAAAGAIAERPEMGGTMLIFLVLPETMVVFGFLVAFFILGKIQHFWRQ